MLSLFLYVGSKAGHINLLGLLHHTLHGPTTDIYCVTVLKAHNPRPGHQKGRAVSADSRIESFPGLSLSFW